MTEASSYLRYLPPALWEEPHPAPALPLGALLRIFEKILTGIADDAPIHQGLTDGKHPVRHESIAEVIDRLHRLFDPWQTPADFLPWLASWVGLELPRIWDEYQRRKAIAEITRIYPKRGPKEGLDRYLNLYTVAATRPRITVDDSAKVLFARLLPDRAATVHALVTQGPFIREGKPGEVKTAAYAGLVSPQCIALTPDGDLLVGDSGMAGEVEQQPVKAGLWRITRAGGYADVTGAPPKPRPLGQQGFPPARPVALAVDERANPWSAYLLDASSKLHRLVSPGLNQATPVTTTPPLQISPVAMALSRAGQLLILDQNSGITVVAGLATGSPQALPRRVLTQVLQPRSLLIHSDGNLIIGDAREQNAPDGAEPTPADLILVDRRDNQNWVEQRLLASVPAGANPLVAPVAIAEENPTNLLVLDIGLKPEPTASEPFRHDIAEPPAVYRVDLGTTPPAVTRVTEVGQFVYPKGMVLHEGTLYLCDPGESHVTPRRVWRALAHEFGVLVHFSTRREPVAGRAQLQKDIMRDIEEIVNSHKPAAALGSVIPRPEQMA